MKDDATPLTPPATPTTTKALVESPAPSGSQGEGVVGPMAGGLVLAVLAVVAFVLTRRRARTTRRMQLVESLSLGPRRSMCLVRVDGRVLVMGVSEAGVQLLTVHDAPEPIEPLDDGAPPTVSQFERLLGQSVEEQDLRARLAGLNRVGP
ncbi:MAG: flagellar biosynthetic protein FliO [Myxococcaceae bacterium]|nr:flagellar biosynthetic protein FliO [Myxococcaceae bacterium]